MNFRKIVNEWIKELYKTNENRKITSITNGEINDFVFKLIVHHRDCIEEEKEYQNI